MSIMNKIGESALLEQTAEECAEMAQAALRLMQYIRGENLTPRTEAELQAALNEDVADVKVCIRALMNGGAIDNRVVSLIMNEKQE